VKIYFTTESCSVSHSEWKLHSYSVYWFINHLPFHDGCEEPVSVEDCCRMLHH